MTNKGAQNVPQRGPRSPWGGGQNLPKKGKFVHHGHHIYCTATKIYPNMSIHSTTPAQYVLPQLGPLRHFRGQKSPERGKLCVTATVLIIERPEFSRTCRSTVPLTQHNMPPNSDWPSCDAHYCQITSAFLFFLNCS